MHSVTRPFLILLTIVGMLSLACASGNENVRPTNTAQCAPELLNAPNGAERFVVEWSDSDRESLESEMHNGVALVKYTCEGIRVLRSCSVPGTYNYRASNSQKKRLESFTDAQSASANLSSPILGAKFQAEFDRGHTLNLDYVMIGSKTTPTRDVDRDQLNRAACQEATHFVYRTQLGAFAIAAGEKGETILAGELLALGEAEGAISSSRHSLSSDGNARDCEYASPNDSEPPHGCGALMHVTIIPLTDGKFDPTAVKKEAHYCKPGDPEACQELCLKGHLESCERMAKVHVDSTPDDADETQLLDNLREIARTLPFLKRTCVEEENTPNACLVAGSLSFMAIENLDPKTTSFHDILLISETSFSLMSRACKVGGKDFCDALYEASVLLDESIIEITEHYYGWGAKPKTQEFRPRALMVMTTACTAGDAHVCKEIAKYRAQK